MTRFNAGNATIFKPWKETICFFIHVPQLRDLQRNILKKYMKQEGGLLWKRDLIKLLWNLNKKGWFSDKCCSPRDSLFYVRDKACTLSLMIHGLTDCPPDKYGVNCSLTCSPNCRGGECDSEDGTCYCDKGWQRKDSSTDVLCNTRKLLHVVDNSEVLEIMTFIELE